MSAIDCVVHTPIGTCDSIPVYLTSSTDALRVLQDFTNTEVVDEPSSLVALIGGGSGEHPALQIHVNEALEEFFYQAYDGVQEFLTPNFQFNANKAPDLDETTTTLFLARMEELSEHLSVDPDGLVSRSTPYRLDLNQWPLESWVRIVKRLEEAAHCPNSTVTPFSTQTDGASIEQHLLAGIGAFLARFLRSESGVVFHDQLHPKLRTILMDLPEGLMDRIPQASLFQSHTLTPEPVAVRRAARP